MIFFMTQAHLRLRRKSRVISESVHTLAVGAECPKLAGILHLCPLVNMEVMHSLANPRNLIHVSLDSSLIKEQI